MAREGVTRAQVFDAADAISATGQNPTVQTIRAKLGSGSFTTITALLREWKSQATEPATELDVPEAVTAALGRAAELVWKAAQDHFAHELATLQKEADRRVNVAETRASEAEAEIERLEAEIERKDNSLIEQFKAGEKQADITTALRSEKAELSAALKAAEARIKEQGDLLKRLIPSTPETKPKKAPAAPKKTAAASLPPEEATTPGGQQ